MLILLLLLLLLLLLSLLTGMMVIQLGLLSLRPFALQTKVREL